jgi:hypothetical protein
LRNRRVVEAEKGMQEVSFCLHKRVPDGSGTLSKAHPNAVDQQSNGFTLINSPVVYPFFLSRLSHTNTESPSLHGAVTFSICRSTTKDVCGEQVLASLNSLMFCTVVSHHQICNVISNKIC